MNISDRTTSNAVHRTYTSLGIKPPKALTDAFARAEKLTEKARHIGARPGDLEQAVTAAVLADRDPATDPDVQRVATAHTLMANAGLADSITGAGLEGIRDACVTHLDSIVADWRSAFDEAAATIVAAHKRIGDLPLTDTDSILAMGGDIAQVWAAAKQADQAIDRLLNGWLYLMTLVRVPLDARHRALRLAELSFEQWSTLPAKLTAWDAVCARLTLALPDLDQYRARVADIQQAQAQPPTVIESWHP